MLLPSGRTEQEQPFLSLLADTKDTWLFRRTDFEGSRFRFKRKRKDSEEQQVGNVNDSEVEAEEKNKPPPLTVTDAGSSESVQQDRNIRQAKWLCQTNMEKDYLSFLKEFPAQKAEIEKCIACLRETADAISKTHKDCTIANTAGSGAGVTSGILTILGLTLTPVTAGGSLILTAIGLGLSVAATTISLSANISEQIISSKHSKQSQELIDRCVKSLNKCKGSLLATLLWLDLDSTLSPDGKEPTMEEKLKSVLKLVAEQLPKVVNTVMDIKRNLQALKQATAAGQASQASLKGVKQVEKTFQGTALAISKKTRVLGVVGAGVGILFDTISIVQSAIHLAKGAQAEKATKIREAANKLEKMLQNLSEQYEQLKRHGLHTFPAISPLEHSETSE